jgi:hypothetical protein
MPAHKMMTPAPSWLGSRISTATAKGGDANARKQAALVIAADQDELYERLTDAESAYAALHAVVKVLEVRATIGMSILRSQGRA